MKLNDLVRRIEHTGASDAEIGAITYDSRKAGPVSYTHLVRRPPNHKKGIFGGQAGE